MQFGFYCTLVRHLDHLWRLFISRGCFCNAPNHEEAANVGRMDGNGNDDDVEMTRTCTGYVPALSQVAREIRAFLMNTHLGSAVGQVVFIVQMRIEEAGR